jgi:hypothetical protein
MRQGLAAVSVARIVRVVPTNRPRGMVGEGGAVGDAAGESAGRTRLARAANRRLALCAACGLLIGGCSSAGYDREHAERLRAYGGAAEFAPLATEPTPCAGGAATLRLPREFVDQIDDPKLATPPFLRDVPGFAAAYRVMRPVGTTQVPVMLIVWVVPTAERRRDEVKRSILEQVRGDESFDKATWAREPRQVQDAAGQARTWDVLTLDGNQPFDLVDAGSPVEKRQPGITEIWVSAEPRQKSCVVLGWRVPKDVAATVPVAALAPLTARSVQIAE